MMNSTVVGFLYVQSGVMNLFV